MQRARYSDEQRKDALMKMSEIGAAKTSNELGIPTATLYAWKNAENKNKAEPKPVAEKRVKKAPVQSPEDVIENIRAKLVEDDGLQERVQALEAENAKLRETVGKLKRMMLAALEN